MAVRNIMATYKGTQERIRWDEKARLAIDFLEDLESEANQEADEFWASLGLGWDQ
jgi:hypothetical protein